MREREREREREKKWLPRQGLSGSVIEMLAIMSDDEIYQIVLLLLVFVGGGYSNVDKKNGR